MPVPKRILGHLGKFWVNEGILLVHFTVIMRFLVPSLVLLVLRIMDCERCILQVQQSGKYQGFLDCLLQTGRLGAGQRQGGSPSANKIWELLRTIGTGF